MRDVMETSESDLLRSALQFLASTIGPMALLAFGIALWAYGASENVFTFAAWGTLDILIAASMMRAGSRTEAVLPLAYGIIAFFVVGMILRNGKWEWGFVETACAVGSTLALIGWWRGGPVVATVMASATMLVAGVPLFVANYHEPQTWEWWLWAAAGTSALLSLYLSRPLRLANISDWMFAATSAGYSFAVLAVLFQ